ncbi:MAG: hypothetical protein M0Z36_12725 [Thermaerobacter sp.]|nr:hypothetical protein [Thermaerobacter sp.]
MRVWDVRTPLFALLWIQAWLALPWLATELSLPAPFAQHFVWNKVWAMALLPAIVSLTALAHDLGTRRSGVTVGVLLGGLGYDTFYLWHHLPPPAAPAVVERWLAAASALAALTVLMKSRGGEALPALEISAGAVLLLAFIARAPLALFCALSLLALSLILVHRRTDSMD